MSVWVAGSVPESGLVHGTDNANHSDLPVQDLRAEDPYRSSRPFHNIEKNNVKTKSLFPSRDAGLIYIKLIVGVSAARLPTYTGVGPFSFASLPYDRFAIIDIWIKVWHFLPGKTRLNVLMGVL